METSLMIYLIVFLVVVFLIFKFIKKIIVAIFTLVFVVALIFAGVGSLIYMDYKDIVENDAFDVNLFYGELAKPEFGVVVPFENGKMNIARFSDYNMKDYKSTKVEAEENNFYIFVDKTAFEKLLDEDTKYSLLGLEDLDLKEVNLKTTYSKDEVLEIMDSDKPEDLELKKYLFFSILLNPQDNSMSGLIMAFKEEGINIYPEKFGFKFLRWLPLNWLVETSNLEVPSK